LSLQALMAIDENVGGQQVGRV